MLKMTKPVNVADLKREAAVRLRGVLSDVPSLAVSSKVATGPDQGVDFVLSLRARLPQGKAVSMDRKLICQVKSSGQPRIAREACLLLAAAARSDARAYPIFIAPYISPAAGAICEQYKTGYVDFAGNCRLAFDSVFIKREGFPNPTVQKRELRSLYSPKAERVLRVLVASGPRVWRTQALADAAQVSLGQVASVKKLLTDREWIASTEVGFALAGYGLGSPHGSGDGLGNGYGFSSGSGARSGNGSGLADGADGAFQVAAWPLISEWVQNYRAARNEQNEFYSLKPIPEIEAKVAELAVAGKKQIAFTGFSAAARFAPAVRYQRVTAYVADGIDAVAQALGLKSVSSGANVALIKPYDGGVFFGTSRKDGAPVVSPIQTYLDLTSTKGRGDEAAQAILEEVIKPQWR